MAALRRSKRSGGAGTSATQEPTKNNESLFEGIVFAFDRQTVSPSDATLGVISDEGGTVLTRRPSVSAPTNIQVLQTHELL